MSRLFFVAGESSGDQHAAGLIAALREQRPGLECEGLGGVQMAEAGMHLRHDLAGEAIMGFVEVARRFPGIRRLFLDTVAHLRATRPDALVLVDYPGFNLRLAKAVQALGIPVIYYISPQVWAWKKDRLRTIAQTVRKMLVIFPFEEDFYLEAGVDATYVGHPLVDHIAAYTPREALPGDPLIGLLPGSRAQEIDRLLPRMLDTARRLRHDFPHARFATPAVSAARAEQVARIAHGFPLLVREGGMYEVLGSARFALVASGTATLQTALFRVPMCIVYRVNPMTYWLARRLVDIEHIGMVNILAQRRLAPEFIQHEATPQALLGAARTLIEDTPERHAMLQGFDEVRARLGDGGASQRAAREILTLLDGGPM